MSADWPEVRLEEITSKLGDGLHGTPKYDENGEYFFINGNNLNNGKIVIDEKTKRSTEKEYLKHKKNLNDRTILVSINGTIGNVALYNGEKVFLGKSACFFNVNEDVDKQFIRYVITSNYFQNYIKSLATGSTIKNVSLKLMRDFTFRLPPLEVQKEISKVLEDLDKKIELNRQTNQTLEQIAQAIFKSWFVDFEPTRAKIAAKKRWQAIHQSVESSSPTCYTEQLDSPNQNGSSLDDAMTQAAMAAISGKTEEQLKELDDAQGSANVAGGRKPGATEAALQQLKTTAALFPDALVESELGEIPEGWAASTLGQHFNVVMGQSPKGDTYNEEGEGMLFFQGRRDFGFRYPTPRVYTTDPKRIAQDGDTLISVRAPVGDRNMAAEECCLGRGVAGIRYKSGSKSFTFAFVGHIENKLSDSGSDGTVFSSINKNELNAVGFVSPSGNLVSFYEETVCSIDERIEIASKEIKTLENIRHALLPKLLSGAITPNERQSIAKEVA